MKKYKIILSCLLVTLFATGSVACGASSEQKKEADTAEAIVGESILAEKSDEKENKDEETLETNSSEEETDALEDVPEDTPLEETIEPEDTDYVLVRDYIPSIIEDLKYATTDNFTGTQIYNFSDAYLRYGTVKKLMQVNAEFNSLGYTIKIWDAYRPFSAQEYMWTVYPDGRYVANPKYGPKAHNLGGTMDITLCTLDGQEVLMPTGFDDFSLLADRDYSDVSEEAAANSMFLESIMTKYGFTGYSGEWWDYSDTTTYEYLDFEP